MFDKIGWLHISDLHLKSLSESWSQDVVLRAMHKAISDRCATRPLDFVLATGDLSYSGKSDEFIQVAEFFDAVLKDVGLSRGDLFFVPGNHDNDLSVQKYSVIGARATVTNSGQSDDLVGNAPELEQILSRQSAYQEFVGRFVPPDLWQFTPDGLGYVATKTLSPLRISIMGLNSAWLCLSGQKDRGNVVVGERQIIEAVKAVQQERPHFVIALIHHPTFWLSEFEHMIAEDRLRRSCDFILRGHLHETDVQTHVAGDRNCLFVAAGASFETREKRNSFNHVELDIGKGICTITTFEYRPMSGEFIEAAPQNITLAFRHLPKPNALSFASAIAQVAPELLPIAAYLACLLSGDKSEYLAFEDGRVVFLSRDALDALDAGGVTGLSSLTRLFVSLSNLCTFTENEEELRSALTNYRARLCEYGQRLLALATEHTEVREALSTRDEEAKIYMNAKRVGVTRNTVELLRDLRRSDDLATLEQFASRYVDDPHPEVRLEAVRGLAIVNARSPIEADRDHAASSLSELCDSRQSEAEDFATLIQLLIDLDQVHAAKDRIRGALKRFPERLDGFAEIGMTLVNLTGDRAFRDELLELKEFRREGS